MDGPSPARLYAALAGAILVSTGIVGFFYSASFGSPGDVDDVFGVFAVNGWSNVLHILAGAVGLLAADYASRAYSLCLGAIWLTLALWGFAIGAGEAILGFVPVDTGVNVFHLALGALGIWAGISTPAKRSSALAQTAS